MEPQLIKIETTNCTDGGFGETDRWKAVLDGVEIGQVWRGKRDAKGCWFVVPSCHGISLHQSYVGAGYAATTKKGAVADLKNWHDNQPLFREIAGVALHVFSVKEDSSEKTADILAVLPDGSTRWIYTVHRKSLQPQRGAQAEPGWYANSRRGNRYVGADNCSSEEEAIELLLPEVLQAAEREDKLAIPPQVRIKGSLSAALETAA